VTVYGGKDRGDGIILDGFFISCCKCGWHSKVEWYGNVANCLKCGNRYVNKNLPTKEEYDALEGGDG
jgi:hypothetical protein